MGGRKVQFTVYYVCNRKEDKGGDMLRKRFSLPFKLFSAGSIVVVSEVEYSTAPRSFEKRPG